MLWGQSECENGVFGRSLEEAVETCTRKGRTDLARSQRRMPIENSPHQQEMHGTLQQCTTAPRLELQTLEAGEKTGRSSLRMHQRREGREMVRVPAALHALNSVTPGGVSSTAEFYLET